jgi:hypothetical protein
MNYINPYQNRIVKVLHNGEWVKTKFEDLRMNDQFVMFDDNEEKIPVKDFKNNTIFVAVSNPYLQKNELGFKVLTIKTES